MPKVRIIKSAIYVPEYKIINKNDVIEISDENLINDLIKKEVGVLEEKQETIKRKYKKVVDSNE